MVLWQIEPVCSILSARSVLHLSHHVSAHRRLTSTTTTTSITPSLELSMRRQTLPSHFTWTRYGLSSLLHLRLLKVSRQLYGSNICNIFEYLMYLPVFCRVLSPSRTGISSLPTPLGMALEFSQSRARIWYICLEYPLCSTLSLL